MAVLALLIVKMHNFIAAPQPLGFITYTILSAIIQLCTRGGIHPVRDESASPRQKHGDVSWVVSTPRAPASLHLLALQLKLSLKAPELLLFTPSLLVVFQGTRGIGRGVLITLQIGQFCRSAGNQADTHSCFERFEVYSTRQCAAKTLTLLMMDSITVTVLDVPNDLGALFTEF